MSSLSEDTISLRRPNGRLPACDPCHRRKVACDHNQPVCNRCKARNQASKCVYLISDVSSKRRRLSQSECGDEDSSEPQPSSTDSGAPPTLAVGEGPSDRSSGFLGSLSYSSVYDEARQTLSLIQGLSPNVSASGSSPEAAGAKITSMALQPHVREQCFAVLRTLPRLLDGEAWERALPNPHEEWSIDAARRIMQSLRKNYAQYLSGTLSDSKLEKMAITLCQNTSLPTSDNVDDAEQWLSQFCGPHLRWESLGLVFSFRDAWCEVGVGEKHGPGSRADIQGELRRLNQNLANVCLGLCIDLSRKFSPGNSILMKACIRRTAIESQISGDASSPTWQVHGLSVALMTFLGHHAEHSSIDYQPSLCSEVKRFVAIHTFVMDKVIVFFTGRPPLISRRHFTTPPPLDLKGAVLYKDKEARIAAAKLLDPNGWSTDGKVHSVTNMRARFMNALLRDEVIDIALFEGQNTSLDTMLNLRQRQLKLYEDFPTPVIYSRGQVDDLGIPTRILVSRLLLRLEHLQNLFVLERLLQRNGYPNSGELLQTSFEMLSNTLLFWRRKDRFSFLLEDFSWIVMAFGTSAGGILCMELLNPSFAGVHPLNNEITRSSIIQQLSLLVAFLDWVPTGGPNGSLCQNCSSVVQSILDHALNSGTGASWPEALENIQLDFSFDLLDSFDWMRATGD